MSATVHLSVNCYVDTWNGEEPLRLVGPNPRMLFWTQGLNLPRDCYKPQPQVLLETWNLKSPARAHTHAEI